MYDDEIFTWLFLMNIRYSGKTVKKELAIRFYGINI
jgi:hypothetical protein